MLPDDTPALPLAIETMVPPDTTVESLVTEVVPALHARLVGDDAPTDPLSIALKVDGCGLWTMRIRGRVMRVDAGHEPRPTLWMHTTERAVARFLEDARRPGWLLSPPGAGVATVTDPRVIKRIAMANGRIELALRHEDGERVAVVFGFGDAARRPIRPEAPDATAEGTMKTLDRAMRGELRPDEAITSGEVKVHGSRLLVMQLALAIAPFCVPTRSRP
jgi:putative sterol carrier protein